MRSSAHDKNYVYSHALCECFYPFVSVNGQIVSYHEVINKTLTNHPALSNSDCNTPEHGFIERVHII